MNISQHFEVPYHHKTDGDRARIAADTEAFLERGGKITPVPTGVSGYVHDPKKFEVAKVRAKR